MRPANKPAPSKLDAERFAKIFALVIGGKTRGEHEAAVRRATVVAQKAGLTLEEAASNLDGGAWADYLRTQAGWNLASQAALFARTKQEALLDAAVAEIATWEYWPTIGGAQERSAATLDGIPVDDLWRAENLTPNIRAAVVGAYAWPSNLDGLLAEVKEWDGLYRSRREVLGNEWPHFPEVECRISLLRHALDAGQAVASWSDLEARFAWRRYKEEDGGKWDDWNELLLDRIEKDFAILRRQYGEPAAPKGHMTNAEKREAVLSMLDTQPHLSDREIARRLRVSPQTVNSWRKRR